LIEANKTISNCPQKPKRTPTIIEEPIDPIWKSSELFFHNSSKSVVIPIIEKCNNREHYIPLIDEPKHAFDKSDKFCLHFIQFHFK
jgi:hypothetical protein